MSEKIILVGGGGHALSLIEAIPKTHEVVGYTALEQSVSMPVKWLGTDMEVLTSNKNEKFHIAFVYSGLPIMDVRRKIIDKYEKGGAEFSSIIAESATVTQNSSIAPGCAILNGAIVNRAHLSAHVIINSGAIVEHDCSIGSNTFIGPGVVIGGGVTIGCDCFIGLGTRIKNGVTIASGVSVGMGAVVTTDLTEPGIYHDPTKLKFHSLKKLRR